MLCCSFVQQSVSADFGDQKRDAVMISAPDTAKVVRAGFPGPAFRVPQSRPNSLFVLRVAQKVHCDCVTNIRERPDCVIIFLGIHHTPDIRDSVKTSLSDTQMFLIYLRLTYQIYQGLGGRQVLIHTRSCSQLHPVAFGPARLPARPGRLGRARFEKRTR